MPYQELLNAYSGIQVHLHQFGLEDISFDKVQQVIDTINQELKLNITDDPLTFLLKHDLVRDGAITNAAYLLFTKKEILFTTVELGLFQTSIIIKDTARSKCDILNQVDEVLNFVKKHINKEVIITEKQTDCGLLQSGRYYRKIR